MWTELMSPSAGCDNDIATRTENECRGGVGGGVASSGSFASATSATAATFELILTVLWQRQRRLQLHSQMEPYPRQPKEKFCKRGEEIEGECVGDATYGVHISLCGQ